MRRAYLWGAAAYLWGAPTYSGRRRPRWPDGPGPGCAVGAAPV